MLYFRFLRPFNSWSSWGRLATSWEAFVWLGARLTRRSWSPDCARYVERDAPSIGTECPSDYDVLATPWWLEGYGSGIRRRFGRARRVPRMANACRGAPADFVGVWIHHRLCRAKDGESDRFMADYSARRIFGNWRSRRDWRRRSANHCASHTEFGTARGCGPASERVVKERT